MGAGGRGEGSCWLGARFCYLFKELIHEVVPVHMDHLLLIIAVFRLGGKERQSVRNPDAPSSGLRAGVLGRVTCRGPGHQAVTTNPGCLVAQSPGGRVPDSPKDTLEGISQRHRFEGTRGPVSAVTLEAGGALDRCFNQPVWKYFDIVTTS